MLVDIDVQATPSRVFVMFGAVSMERLSNAGRQDLSWGDQEEENME
jgi:hypothetical protein